MSKSSSYEALEKENTRCKAAPTNYLSNLRPPFEVGMVIILDFLGGWGPSGAPRPLIWGSVPVNITKKKKYGGGGFLFFCVFFGLIGIGTPPFRQNLSGYGSG